MIKRADSGIGEHKTYFKAKIKVIDFGTLVLKKVYLR
jgi:hypothetical protein